jgi:hypothetical protein
MTSYVHIEEVHLREIKHSVEAFFTSPVITLMVIVSSLCYVWLMPTLGATTVKGTYRRSHSPALLLQCPPLQTPLRALWLQGRDPPPRLWIVLWTIDCMCHTSQSCS